MNGAGLVTTIHIQNIIADSSGPNEGFVKEHTSSNTDDTDYVIIHLSLYFSFVLELH